MGDTLTRFFIRTETEYYMKHPEHKHLQIFSIKFSRWGPIVEPTKAQHKNKCYDNSRQEGK